MTAVLAVAYLAAFLVLSSSLNPLFVVFGASWQAVAALSGVVFGAVLVVAGMRARGARA